MGYCKGDAYRVLNLPDSKMIESKDVILNDDMEVTWKEKKVIEFDRNDSDFIFDDYESGEGAVIGRAHESADEEEKTSYQKNSNHGSQLNDKNEHNNIENDGESDEETVKHLTYYPAVCRTNHHTAGIPPSRLGNDEASTFFKIVPGSP